MSTKKQRKTKEEIHEARVRAGRLGGLARSANLAPDELAILNSAAGRAGAAARAASLTPRRRRAIARAAAAARWAKPAKRGRRPRA